MNKENCQKIRQWVIDHADNLNVRLPPEDDLYCQRNAWCHLFGCIDDVYNVRGRGGYKVIPDSEFDNVINILQIAYDHGEEQHISHYFPKPDQLVLDKINNIERNTLDQFFQ